MPKGVNGLCVLLQKLEREMQGEVQSLSLHIFSDKSFRIIEDEILFDSDDAEEHMDVNDILYWPIEYFVNVIRENLNRLDDEALEKDKEDTTHDKLA